MKEHGEATDRHQHNRQVSRRQFLRNSIFAAGGTIAAGLLYPAVRYFLYPAIRSQETPPFTPLVPLATITIGQPIFLTYEERTKDGWAVVTKSKGAWVVYRGGDDVTVFNPSCTHLGCGYSWSTEKALFLCPCHAGVFDISGKVLSGPPPRPLDRIEHRIDNGTLFVGQTVSSA